MYEISDLWEHKRIDIATEHICSNIAHSLVKIINEEYMNGLTTSK